MNRQINSDLLHMRQQNDWEQYHTAKNLILAVCSEAGELAEIARWRDDDQIHAQYNAVRMEAADVAIMLLNLAQVMRFDLTQAVEDKIAVNRCRQYSGPDKV